MKHHGRRRGSGLDNARLSLWKDLQVVRQCRLQTVLYLKKIYTVFQRQITSYKRLASSLCCLCNNSDEGVLHGPHFDIETQVIPSAMQKPTPKPQTTLAPNPWPLFHISSTRPFWHPITLAYSCHWGRPWFSSRLFFWLRVLSLQVHRLLTLTCRDNLKKPRLESVWTRNMLPNVCSCDGKLLSYHSEGFCLARVLE